MPAGVLTKAQYAAIVKAQRALTENIPLIQDAEYCGHDCTQRKAEMEEMLETLNRWRERFKPVGVEGGMEP